MAWSICFNLQLVKYWFKLSYIVYKDELVMHGLRIIRLSVLNICLKVSVNIS